MRVHELAKELGMKSQELLDRIQKEGLDVKVSALASLDPGMVERIRSLIEQPVAGREGRASSPAAMPGAAARGLAPRLGAGIAGRAGAVSRYDRRSSAPGRPSRPIRTGYRPGPCPGFVSGRAPRSRRPARPPEAAPVAPVGARRSVARVEPSGWFRGSSPSGLSRPTAPGSAVRGNGSLRPRGVRDRPRRRLRGGPAVASRGRVPARPAVRCRRTRGMDTPAAARARFVGSAVARSAPRATPGPILWGTGWSGFPADESGMSTCRRAGSAR